MVERLSDVSLAPGLGYPESPRWRNGRLWISDVHNFALKAFTAEGVLEFKVAVPGRPAGLGFDPNGTLLIATALDRTLMRLYDGRLTLLADLSALTKGLLNDMVVDAAGRAYVGDTGFDLGAGEAQRPGRLLLLDSAVGARVVAEDVVFPNGMAITSNGTTLFLAETFAQRVTAFRILPNGDLAERRTHVQTDGTPDGICLDAEGGLWIALLATGAFVRIDAAGRETHRWSVAPRHAVACMLGGPGRRTLFACHSTVPESGKPGQRVGVVTAVRAPFAGVGLP